MWEALCHLDGPQARAGADVENPPWVVERSEVELAAEEEGHDMVLEVQSIELRLRYRVNLETSSDTYGGGGGKGERPTSSLGSG
jgi:hypothetical protein